MSLVERLVKDPLRYAFGTSDELAQVNERARSRYHLGECTLMASLPIIGFLYTKQAMEQIQSGNLEAYDPSNVYWFLIPTGIIALDVGIRGVSNFLKLRRLKAKEHSSDVILDKLGDTIEEIERGGEVPVDKVRNILGGVEDLFKEDPSLLPDVDVGLVGTVRETVHQWYESRERNPEVSTEDLVALHEIVNQLKEFENTSHLSEYLGIIGALETAYGRLSEGGREYVNMLNDIIPELSGIKFFTEAVIKFEMSGSKGDTQTYIAVRSVYLSFEKKLRDSIRSVSLVPELLDFPDGFQEEEAHTYLLRQKEEDQLGAHRIYKSVNDPTRRILDELTQKF